MFKNETVFRVYIGQFRIYIPTIVSDESCFLNK